MISGYNENALQSALTSRTEISQPFKRSIIFFLNAAERYISPNQNRVHWPQSVR
jgi:hypothetical protein